jgi:iron-sulfur cluster repair protein YtfE (RIC family)
VPRDELLVQQVKDALTLHIGLEEAVFYPACARHPPLRALVNESYQDHDEVKGLMEQIGGVQPGGENTWLRSLIQTVESHVQHEEEALFPLARKLMSQAEIDQLGHELEAAKRAGVTPLQPGMQAGR